MVSSRAANASSYAGNQSRLTYLNEKEKQRPSRPDPPRIVRQHKGKRDSRERERPGKYLNTMIFHLLSFFDFLILFC